MSDKPKVAFFDFTSCEGCQLSVVDALQTHPELLEAVEIVQFREAMSEKGEDYQIAFIEGSCTRPEDEARLQAIREQANLVVALGACAHLGGINAIRNRQNQMELRRYVYGDHAEWFSTYEARPIDAVIQVDAIIPGCPIDRIEFQHIVSLLLQGRQPQLPDDAVCVECRLRENECLYTNGQICLGPVTRGGCNAICPSYGGSCEGCRGLVPHPNMKSLRNLLAEYGMSQAEIEARFAIFLTYQQPTARMENAGNGHS